MKHGVFRDCMRRTLDSNGVEDEEYKKMSNTAEEVTNTCVELVT